MFSFCCCFFSSGQRVASGNSEQTALPVAQEIVLTAQNQRAFVITSLTPEQHRVVDDVITYIKPVLASIRLGEINPLSTDRRAPGQIDKLLPYYAAYCRAARAFHIPEISTGDHMLDYAYNMNRNNVLAERFLNYAQNAQARYSENQTGFDAHIRDCLIRHLNSRKPVVIVPEIPLATVISQESSHVALGASI